MYLKYFVLLTSVVLVVNCSTITKRDAPISNDPFAALKKNMESFKNCIDQSLASAVNDVDVQKHIQPVVNVIGDQLFKFSKVFEVLTGSTTPDTIDL